MSNHFYTMHPNAENAPGYHSEGNEGFVYPSAVEGTVALRRFFNKKIGNHFYTIDPSGEGCEQKGYDFHMIACYVYPPTSNVTGTAILYRWHSDGDHFYCLDPKGETAPADRYRFDGPACRVHVNQMDGTVPFYRYFNGPPARKAYCTWYEESKRDANGWGPWKHWIRITTWARTQQDYENLSQQQFSFWVKQRFGSEFIEDFRFRRRGYKEGVCDAYLNEWDWG